MEFFILVRRKKGLHYIQGNLYWKGLDSVEDILNCTRFDTKKEAEEFITERLYGYGLKIKKVTLTLEG
jgi:hypothetical protein